MLVVRGRCGQRPTEPVGTPYGPVPSGRTAPSPAPAGREGNGKKEERPSRGEVAHKHAAVGVTDDQYTIVHKYLFGAIAEVLGDAVTPEVAAAWDEVYWLMAGALIGREARLYQDGGVEPGKVWRQWTVVERRTETPDVVSFLLRPADGRRRGHGRAST